VVCGLSKGPIRWPVGRPPGRRTGEASLVLCGDLAEAVRRESGVAVRHWWGVARDVLRRWRRALGVGAVNEGGHQLRMLTSGEAKRGKRLSEASRRKIREGVRRRYAAQGG